MVASAVWLRLDRGLAQPSARSLIANSGSYYPCYSQLQTTLSPIHKKPWRHSCFLHGHSSRVVSPFGIITPPVTEIRIFITLLTGTSNPFSLGSKNLPSEASSAPEENECRPLNSALQQTNFPPDIRALQHDGGLTPNLILVNRPAARMKEADCNSIGCSTFHRDIFQSPRRLGTFLQVILIPMATNYGAKRDQIQVSHLHQYPFIQ